jgi:hypothetical protein
VHILTVLSFFVVLLRGMPLQRVDDAEYADDLEEA